jgi:hypothetical protein
MAPMLPITLMLGEQAVHTGLVDSGATVNPSSPSSLGSNATERGCGQERRSDTMTEAEWMVCSNLLEMLTFQRGQVSRRKLRLLAAACCRRMWHLLNDVRCRTAIEVAERFADGTATEVDLLNANAQAEIVASLAYDRVFDAAIAEAQASADPHAGDWAHGAHDCASSVSAHAHAVQFLTHRNPCPGLTADEVILALAHAASPLLFSEDCHPDFQKRASLEHEEKVVQVHLLRCIVGNPFRPSQPDPAWLVWKDGTITRLAQGIYTDRAFDRLPILADALEDAGCDNADILAHCRGPGPHVRGCWVLDLLLGKS